MSPRKAAAVSGGASLPAHLIAATERLIARRGAAGLTVRAIAKEARVADGVLYNHFADKEELIARALLAHVRTVERGLPPLPGRAGEGDLAANLRAYVDHGVALHLAILPAFAGLLAQPGVLARFAVLGGGPGLLRPDSPHPGDESKEPEDTGSRGPKDDESEDPRDRGTERPEHDESDSPGDRGSGGPEDRGSEGPTGGGLRGALTRYLRDEQAIGRVAAGADPEAAATMVVGACHELVLPHLFAGTPAGEIRVPRHFAARLVATCLGGLAPH